MVRLPWNIPVEGYMLDWLDCADDVVEVGLELGHLCVVLIKVGVSPRLGNRSNRPFLCYGPAEQYSTARSRLERRMRDNPSISVCCMRPIAYVVCKVLVLSFRLVACNTEVALTRSSTFFAKSMSPTIGAHFSSRLRSLMTA